MAKTIYSVVLFKEYEEIYPEFDIKQIYTYDELIIDKIKKIRIIEFNKFYPQHIFKNVYINSN